MGLAWCSLVERTDISGNTCGAVQPVVNLLDKLRHGLRNLGRDSLLGCASGDMRSHALLGSDSGWRCQAVTCTVRTLESWVDNMWDLGSVGDVDH